MSDKRIPLRFWIGRHVDGSDMQCIVDTDDGPMEGVKQAWDPHSPSRHTTLETTVQPELTRGSERLLELLLGMERNLGNPTTPRVHKLLEEVAMAAYRHGLQMGAPRRGK